MTLVSALLHPEKIPFLNKLLQTIFGCRGRLARLLQ
jgi:hypothetical protein